MFRTEKQSYTINKEVRVENGWKYYIQYEDGTLDIMYRPDITIQESEYNLYELDLTPSQYHDLVMTLSEVIEQSNSEVLNKTLSNVIVQLERGDAKY